MIAGCLDDNTLSILVEGGVEPQERVAIDHHIDRCPSCRILVAAAISSRPSEDEEPVRQRGSALLRYLIVEILGAGGNGVVYAAYDPDLDRKVAIKVMRRGDPNSNDERKQRTQREAQAMARLSHPNVVAVHDVGTVDDKLFVVMEFIEGRTLTEWRAEAPRSWREIVEVFAQAGRGLAAAHAAGLVHRDFKPDNVLIRRDGQVLVTDFGLARAAGPMEPPVQASNPASWLGARMTRSGVAAGTPAYMAPEQLRGAPVDARSDLFSFCVALYEALYDQHPFGGKTLSEMEEQARNGRVRAPPKSSRVPAFIHRQLLRGLPADPEARIASMPQLLSALRRDPSWWRRRAGVLATTAGLAVAALAITHWQKSNSALCRGAERQLSGVWDGTRKQALRAALVDGSGPFAEDRWRSVEAALDDYLHEWIAMRTQVCEATRVSGEQSEPLMELRMGCLDHRLAEVRALVSVLSASPREPADDAARAAYRLSPLSECADADALQARVPPPHEPRARVEVERLRGKIAEAKALRDLGRYHDQAQRASEILVAARQLAYRPIEAEALLLRGMALESNSNFTPAADALREAMWTAEKGRDFKLAVRARAELVWTTHQQGKPEQGIEYAHDGQAILEGLGGDAELEALLADALSSVLGDQGKEDESMKLAELVLEKRRALLGPNHPQTAISMVNVAVGFSELNRPGDALPLYQQALTVYEKAFGIHHPLYAHTLFDIADAEMNLGRYGTARVHAEHALVLIKVALGEEHALVASTENVLGLIAHGEGHDDEAQAHAERALALAEKLRGPRHVFVARYATTLAIAVEAQGGYARALALFRRALSIYQEAGNDLMVARSWSNIGHAQLEMGARAEATVALERALHTQESKDNSAEDVASTRFFLAQALWPGDGERARRLAQAALTGLASAGPTATDSRDQVARWLSEVAGH